MLKRHGLFGRVTDVGRARGTGVADEESIVEEPEHNQRHAYAANTVGPRREDVSTHAPTRSGGDDPPLRRAIHALKTHVTPPDEKKKFVSTLRISVARDAA